MNCTKSHPINHKSATTWEHERKGHYVRGAQIVQKSSNHLKILGTRRVAWSMFHTQNSQILGAIIENLVALVSWHPGFGYPRFKDYSTFSSNISNDIEHEAFLLTNFTIFTPIYAECAYDITHIKRLNFQESTFEIITQSLILQIMNYWKNFTLNGETS